MVKKLGLAILLILMTTSIFGAATVQNVQVLPSSCYPLGQYVTVRFEAKVATAYNWINADIVFSSNAVRQRTDDAVLTDVGTYDANFTPPDSNGHYGYYVLQPGDTSFHTIDVVVRVPGGYSGTYYVFVAVREAAPVSLGLPTNPTDLYDSVASITMGRCPTATITPTATLTHTITPTATFTPTATITPGGHLLTTESMKAFNVTITASTGTFDLTWNNYISWFYSEMTVHITPQNLPPDSYASYPTRGELGLIFTIVDSNGNTVDCSSDPAVLDIIVIREPK